MTKVVNTIKRRCTVCTERRVPWDRDGRCKKCYEEMLFREKNGLPPIPMQISQEFTEREKMLRLIALLGYAKTQGHSSGVSSGAS